MSGRLLFVLVLSCLAFLSSPAWADIVNGDFEQPSGAGWVIPGGASGVSEIVSGYGTNATWVAHLKAVSDFTYTDGEWSGSTGQAVIQQVFTVEEGKTTLLFDAVYSTSGLEVGNATVTYTAFGGGAGTTEVLPGSSWGTYELPLLDGDDQPLAPGTMVLVSVTTEANAPFSAGQENQHVSQLAEGYFDNFRLAVPEPCSLLLILAGLPLIRRR